MAHSNLPHYTHNSIPHSEDAVPDFDLPVGQMVVRVEDVDGVNIIFMPPIPCVMRDPDGQDRPVRLVDSDDLIARVFAGWSLVDCEVAS